MAKRMDEKGERFVRVVERRVNNILVQIDNLARCANRRNYSYTEEDVAKIFAVMEKRLAEARERFTQSGGASREFSLR
jgi:hypothetical protein